LYTNNLIYIYIYTKGSKPWKYDGRGENMQREDIKMLVKKWGDIYNDESLDYKKSKAAATKVSRSDNFRAHHIIK
jgi:hypothetical protein